MSETTLEIPRPPRRPALERSQVVLVFVAVAAASFLAGIVAATATEPDRAGAVIAEGDVDRSGGTIRFPGGQLVFPRGAVDDDQHVIVRRTAIDDRVRVADARRPVVIEAGELFAYSFEPDDVRFAEPIEITFRLKEGARNASVFVPGEGGVRHLPGRVDPVRGTATIRVRDFRFDAG